jgi:hypothetical protein
VPGERDNAPGAAVTTGAFGPFVCPAGTQEIRVLLAPIQVQVFAHGLALNAGAPDLLADVGLPSGTATLDLARGVARWAPDPTDA